MSRRGLGRTLGAALDELDPASGELGGDLENLLDLVGHDGGWRIGGID